MQAAAASGPLPAGGAKDACFETAGSARLLSMAGVEAYSAAST